MHESSDCHVSLIAEVPRNNDRRTVMHLYMTIQRSHFRYMVNVVKMTFLMVVVNVTKMTGLVVVVNVVKMTALVVIAIVMKMIG